MMRINTKQKEVTSTRNFMSGFTLVETMLYVVVAGSLILFMSLFTGMIVDARIKNRTVAEVEEQGNHAMRIMAQTVRNSTVINSPAAGLIDTILNMQTTDSSLNPTIFDLNGGALRIKEGTGSPVNLTNSHVTVSSLSFKNLSWPETSGVIRVSFVISYLNPEGRNEYEFSKTWSTSISLRGD